MSKLDWNIQLNFDLPTQKTVEPAKLAPPPKVDPRELLKEKFPRIYEQVAQSWGSLNLHRYFQDLLTTHRPGRQGFPLDVLRAITELHDEHQELLKKRGLIRLDIWDLQFRR